MTIFFLVIPPVPIEFSSAVKGWYVTDVKKKKKKNVKGSEIRDASRQKKDFWILLFLKHSLKKWENFEHFVFSFSFSEHKYFKAVILGGWLPMSFFDLNLKWF